MAVNTYEISFGPKAKSMDVSEYSKSVIKEIMKASRIYRVIVTSTARDAFDQARVMYDNLEQFGTRHQKNLYGPAGDEIIDVYIEAKKNGHDRNEIITLMKARIIAIGPTKVSRHAADVSKLNVFDISPSTIPPEKKSKWEKEIKDSQHVSKYIFPPKDPGYHFEIIQPLTG
ncbi:MAG: hypothetical protein AAFY56_14570 [Pseudomonadota bacterium]